MKLFRKRVLSNLLSLALIASSVSASYGLTTSQKQLKFSDINNHWAKSAITTFIDRGHIKGYSDGTFRPNSNITRAEFISIVNNAFGFKEKGTENFTDVKSTDWYYGEVVKAMKQGYISGYGDKTFKPNKAITREEACKIIGSIVNVNGDGTILFNDKKGISTWASKYVDGLSDKGIIKGYSDNTFRAKNNITRGESVVVVSNSTSTNNTSGGGSSTTIIFPQEKVILKGIVRSANTGLPIPNITVRIQNSSSRALLYSSSSLLRNSSNEVITDSNGEYEFVVQSGTYMLTVDHPDYIRTVQIVNIDSNYSTQANPIRLVGETTATSGTVKGRITDASIQDNISDQTIAGLQGVTLKFREGINVKQGAIVSTTTTTVGGNYSIELKPGNYTAEASLNQYVTSYFDVVSIGDTIKEKQNYTLSKPINQNQTRIVLTWGEEPLDLDSHLTGPTEDGKGKFHTCYYNKVYCDKCDEFNIPEEINRLEEDGEEYLNNEYHQHENMGNVVANLDVDDVTSFGPETTTIYAPKSQGVYRFSVHDYTNIESTDSKELSNSSAKVEVYQGSTLIKTFYVPTNQIGDLWTVFEMENGVIKPINTIKNVDEFEEGIISNRSNSNYNK